MPELNDQRSIDALRKRFTEFFDAVLVEVVLSLPTMRAGRQATLRVSARDMNGSWKDVVFTVDRLSEFRFAEGQISHLVYSNGLRIHLLDDSTFVDLAPGPEPHATELSELRRSPQFVRGRACFVEVTEQA